jgi:UDP-glucose 4-epimerase
MKRVLITGCSGYIGSHLTKLLENEYEVHGLDILEPQHPVKKFHQIDINRMFNVEEEYDAVVHLAALVNVSRSERIPIQYYITNLNGTMNVLNKIKTKNFIFASTGAAALCESAYGISKRAAEDVVKEYCTVHIPTPYTIFRFYNVIGSSGYAPTNPDGLMYNLMKSEHTKEFTIFGNDYDTPDGTCIRDYTHVDEICEAIRIAIEEPSNGVEGLGHSKGHSVKEMVEIFKRVNQKILSAGSAETLTVTYGPRRPGDAAVSVLKNISRYMKNLYSIEDLLRLDNGSKL